MCNICYVENLRRAEDRKTKLIVLASPPSPSRPVAICLPCLPRLFWDRNIISTLGLWLQRKEQWQQLNNTIGDVLSVFESDIIACKKLSNTRS